MKTSTSNDDASLEKWRSVALNLEQQVASVVIGQTRVIRLINIAVFARGHVLLQGDVGVGKTTLLRAFAQGIGGSFARIEGSVDLMPNDLLYHTYLGENGRPTVDPGPLIRFGDELAIFFFNEINRARPQVHALLLRAMAERNVTAFNREYRLPHLLVFADRNRLEREETFEIAAAARDRFIMEIELAAPVDPELRRALVFDTRFHDVDTLLAGISSDGVNHHELNGIAAHIQRNIQTSAALQKYALDLWDATCTPTAYGVRIEGVDMQRLLLAGASPRGMSMLLQAARVAAWLAGRSYVAPEDVQAVFHETITHRLYFPPVYELRRNELATELTRAIIQHVAAP